MTAIQAKLEADAICNLLTTEVGATGCARIRNGDLQILREENGSWMFYGGVADIEDAQRVIEEFFLQIANTGERRWIRHLSSFECRSTGREP